MPEPAGETQIPVIVDYTSGMPALTRNGVSVDFIDDADVHIACAYAQPGDVLSFGVNAKSVKGGDPTPYIDTTVFAEDSATDIAAGDETLTYTVSDNDRAIFAYTYSS